MWRMKKLIMVFGLVLLSGCASTGEKVAQIHQVVIEPIKVQEVIDIRSRGSIYSSGRNIMLYTDNKASRIGDIITIRLAEETTASKSASTSTTKSNDLNVMNPTLFGSALSIGIPSVFPFGGRSVSLDSLLSSTKTFNGEGDSEQKNKMSGTITALITDVLANGNLVLKGKKRITINNGDEYIHITGIIRPRDISGNNTVYSNKIANAEISYSGTGVVSAANETGWLTRFFNSKWWPL